MIKINLDPEKTLNDIQIAYITLANMCGNVLAYKDLYPHDIFLIAYSYLNNGCRNRADYEYLVNFLIENLDMREELLK